MIHGIGTDIVAVARLSRLLERHGARAARRILSDAEFHEFAAAQDPARFLAKRFAAKEAFAKAYGTGVREPVGLRAISVVHDGLGKPAFVFATALASLLGAQQLRAHLTISDEADHALAFVILEQI